MVDGEEVKDVVEFTYLGATVDKEVEGNQDIMHRPHKAQGTFQRLKKGLGS